MRFSRPPTYKRGKKGREIRDEEGEKGMGIRIRRDRERRGPASNGDGWEGMEERGGGKEGERISPSKSK